MLPTILICTVGYLGFSKKGGAWQACGVQSYNGGLGEPPAVSRGRTPG